MHRDIKPANIMIERVAPSQASQEGASAFRPIIMDFGLAREAGDGQGLTESGAVMGTPAYMSPEQARGDVRHLDQRTDVYSLGATLYDILSGAPPFEDETVVNIILKVLNEDVRPLRQRLPTIPESLETIVGKCLNKEPAQRYTTAQELADDLGRFLSNQRIVGKKVSLWYRLQYRARRNKPVAALLLALAISLMGLTAYGIRTRIQSARQEREAQRLATLTQKLGQDIKDIEWVMRTAYSLPLHNAEVDKVRVRTRMARLSDQAMQAGGLGRGLAEYGQGRGFLALHEYRDAEKHLQQALAAGLSLPELHFALGQVLGELFSQALDEARRSGDKSFVERRRQALAEQYLKPALAQLHKSQQLGLQTDAPSFIAGLIAFYQRKEEDALKLAQRALAEAPWLYEAQKLQGDVYLGRALDNRDRGQLDDADRNFALALARYGEAAEIGRSDYRVHEATAEAWVRQMEIDAYQRGKNPEPKLTQALAAADRALAAAPTESYGNTKKAYAYLFQTIYYLDHGEHDKKVDACQRLIAFGNMATQIHPEDAYGFEVTGYGHTVIANHKAQARHDERQSETEMRKAYTLLEKAISLNRFFPWAYSDLGLAHLASGTMKKDRNQDGIADLIKSVSLQQMAIDIDPEYVYAFGNMAEAAKAIVKTQFEKGINPLEWTEKAIKFAGKLTSANPRDPSPYYHSAEARVYHGDYLFMNNLEIEETLSQVLSDINKGLKVDGSFIPLLEIKSQAYLVIANYRLAHRLDPSASIEAGLAAAEQCLRLRAAHAACQMLAGQLWAARARRQDELGTASQASWAQAQKSVLLATESGPQERDGWLARADVAYRYARSPRSSPAARRQAVQAGLAAIDRALTLAPDWPRALAEKALLLLAEARITPAEQHPATTAAKAVGLLERAARQNPSLSTFHAQELSELRSIAAGG